MRHSQAVLARQILTIGMKRFVVLFSVVNRRQETFANLCDIGVSKGKTVNLPQLQITFNFKQNNDTD